MRRKCYNNWYEKPYGETLRRKKRMMNSTLLMEKVMITMDVLGGASKNYEQ